MELHSRDVPPESTTALLSMTAMNLAETSGTVTAAYVKRSDGARVATSRVLPVPVTSSLSPSGALVSLPAGEIPRLAAPEDGRPVASPHVLTVSVEYQDTVGLLTWRQSSIYREQWRHLSNPNDPHGAPVLAYTVDHESWCEPVIAAGAAGAAAARPARRRWRRR